MHLREKLTKLWAYGSMILVAAVIVFLFGYVFREGWQSVTWEFLTQSPGGTVLGSAGGIWPAITGSLWFAGMALVIGGIPAIACAVYAVFFCRKKAVFRLIRGVMQSISGIPSIVLGLFSYSLFVRILGLGRCILSGSIGLGVMILPFIEVRAEKAFLEVPKSMVESSYALGCSRFYTFQKIVLPYCKGELISAVILGGCYAMGATAPLMFTGAVAYAKSPASIMEPAMALPMHLYLLVSQGQTSMPAAYGTACVMMVIILVSNLAATQYARRCRAKWHQS